MSASALAVLERSEDAGWIQVRPVPVATQRRLKLLKRPADAVLIEGHAKVAARPFEGDLDVL